MPINNVKVQLAGKDLQVNTNGVVAHKLQVMDDYLPWLSRAAVVALREDDDSLGFDVTMLTGRRVRVVYGSAAPVVVQQNNDDVLGQLYRKVLQTSFDITGTSLTLADASELFTLYTAHQIIWGKRAQLLAQIQDPDITRTRKGELVTSLTSLVWTPMTLNLMGNSYQVIFGDGMTCQFTNWLVGNYTDFTFNLVQRETLA